MRKIPFAGIELTSQRVRGYMVPLSYRGDRQIIPENIILQNLKKNMYQVITWNSEKEQLFEMPTAVHLYLLHSLSNTTKNCYRYLLYSFFSYVILNNNETYQKLIKLYEVKKIMKVDKKINNQNLLNLV